jgi:hypothetical protein
MVFPLLAGVHAGLFYSHRQENESLLRILERVPMDMWDVYTEGNHKDTIYVTDYGLDDRAEFITIYSDGVAYAGKNRVQLDKDHRRRIKKIYVKIKKSKSEVK